MFAARGLKGPPCGTPFFPPTLMISLTRCRIFGSCPLRAILPSSTSCLFNIIEVLGQIDVDDRCHPAHQAAPDFRQGTMRRPLGAEPVRVRAEVSLEDRFED